MRYLTTKELGDYSLSKALRLTAQGELTGCLEGEVSAEVAARTGRQSSANSMIVPFEVFERALAPFRTKRDMTVAGASGSNYLVTDDVQSPVDVLRPWSVTAKAGVLIQSGLVGDAAIPKTNTAIVGEWLSSESAPITASQPVIGSLAMSPKIAAALVKYSYSLKRNVPFLDAYLARDLIGTASTLLDKAVIFGTGVGGQPLGIANTSGIVTASGSTLGWAALQEVIEDLADANAREESLAFIGSPIVRKLLSQRARLSGGSIPVWNNQEIAGFPAHVTTAAPASSLTVGSFTDVTVGVWGAGIEVSADPYTHFKTGVTQFRVLLPVDVGVTSPASFAHIGSIT